LDVTTRLSGVVPSVIQETSKIQAGTGELLKPGRPTDQNGFVRLLLVEDDRAIASSLTEGLAADGHVVELAATGAAAVAAAANGERHDMVLLDLGLPDIDGRDVCRTIRSRSNIPIIMITARGDELDRVLGLELGADDYVTKPFSIREVLARIRAVARRTTVSSLGEEVDAATADDSAQVVGGLSIDHRTRRVHVDGILIELTAKEFDVLACLADDAGAVRTRTEILEQVWDMNWFGPTKTVDAHVAALRKKLGDARWIEAVRGVGFRLEVPTDPTADPTQ